LKFSENPGSEFETAGKVSTFTNIPNIPGCLQLALGMEGAEFFSDMLVFARMFWYYR
jgi:hypothetical protein